MGDAKRKASATQKFVAEFPHCYFCGGRRRSTTREHMPPKSLFDNAHRPDKLVMPACDACNKATSTADLTASIISRWDYGASTQSNADHSKLVARMRRQAPDVANEWMSMNTARAEYGRRHLMQHGVPVPVDAGIMVIGPRTTRQLNLFAHKAVLALYFEHFKNSLSCAGRVCAYWRSKEDFALNGIPSGVLDALPQYGTLIQGQWNERETFEYRFDFNRDEGLFGCAAKLRNGLFVVGFAVADGQKIAYDVDDWVKPADPDQLLSMPIFHKKR